MKQPACTTKPTFKTLLVAIDGSKKANRVLMTAKELAIAFDAKVIVLSVYRHHSNIESSHALLTGNSPETKVPIDFAMRDLAHQSVKASVEYLKAEGVTRVTGLVKRGGISKTILQVADKNEVGAIVIGSRGLGEFEGLLLGSVSHKVNLLAKCSCITVR